MLLDNYNTKYKNGSNIVFISNFCDLNYMIREQLDILWIAVVISR